MSCWIFFVELYAGEGGTNRRSMWISLGMLTNGTQEISMPRDEMMNVDTYFQFKGNDFAQTHK